MTNTPSPEKKNRRLGKAVAAGALGVALLAGLGTTFAKWYADGDIGQAQVQSGHLRFSQTDPVWVDVNNGNKAVDPTTFRMVPGDKLQYSTTVTPDLVGDNLVATLSVDTSGVVPEAATDFVKVTSEVAGGTTERQVTPADSGNGIAVTVTLEYPLTRDGNAPAADKSNWWGQDGQDATVNLGATTVELTQNDNPATP